MNSPPSRRPRSRASPAIWSSCASRASSSPSSTRLPAITMAIQSVISVAELIVVPTRPSPHDLRAVGATVDLCERAGKPLLFVVNAATPRARITSEAAIALSQHGTVAPVTIHHRTDYASSMIDGRTVMDFEPKRQVGPGDHPALDLHRRPSRAELPPHCLLAARSGRVSGDRAASGVRRRLRPPYRELMDKNGRTMPEIRPAASLTSSLLARRGDARPAMRRQAITHLHVPLTPHDDLGWNDYWRGGRARAAADHAAARRHDVAQPGSL